MSNLLHYELNRFPCSHQSIWNLNFQINFWNSLLIIWDLAPFCPFVYLEKECILHNHLSPSPLMIASKFHIFVIQSDRNIE